MDANSFFQSLTFTGTLLCTFANESITRKQRERLPPAPPPPAPQRKSVMHLARCLAYLIVLPLPEDVVGELEVDSLLPQVLPCNQKHHRFSIRSHKGPRSHKS